jgi:hypothetical protein
MTPTRIAKLLFDVLLAAWAACPERDRPLTPA